MCGRYTLTVEMDELAERFGCLTVVPDLKPRYNVAPTQLMPIVAAPGGQRHLQMMQWGLVPFWAKDKSIGNKLINARVETLEQKPAFKNSLLQRRCIVPADGYYEWQKTSQGKQAMRIIRPAPNLFGFAGLWEQWRQTDGELLFSYTILTTSPIPSLAHIHDRMPLILDPDQEDYWLHGLRGTSSAEVGSFLSRLKPPEQMSAYPVSNRVNSPKNDDLECIQPI